MPEICELIAAAVDAEGGTPADVLGGDRKGRASRPRQAAMWLAFKVTPHSISEIGRAFGRHHTTVLYGIGAHERRLAANAAVRRRSEALLERFFAAEDEALPGYSHVNRNDKEIRS
jgi:chromosomal replication initiation ATPase DnaA